MNVLAHLEPNACPWLLGSAEEDMVASEPINLTKKSAMQERDHKGKP